MKLPKLTDLDVSGRKVLVRLDLDVGKDFTRIETAKETLLYLAENRAKIIIIGHKGRPERRVDESLSLRSLSEEISKLINREVVFSETLDVSNAEIVLLENLRFNPGEETNDEAFAKELSSLADFYVNEAFAASHREHASIIGIAKLLPHAAGFRFLKEVENLSKITENPKRPVVVIISGIKEDKVEMAKNLTKIADKVLVGGKLPIYFGDENQNPEKLIIGSVTFDGFDITLNTVGKFKQEIAKAGTVVLAGVLGKYEDGGHRQGTKKVFEAVANSSSFKVAGGGDTEAALTMFGLTDKFDWISVGGGAMLEFLATGTLVGIEALKV